MKAKERYILWRRVSTKQQGDSELGLKAQIAIAEYFMQGAPERIFTDVYSGTKLTKCQALWQAISFAKEHKIQLVVAKTDRFRNVIEALTVLDEMGEGNVTFCDLPTTDRTVLTMVFAMWERQAIQGRINTRLALAERKKMADAKQSWISRAGNLTTKLGRPADGVNEKGEEYWDLSQAHDAASMAHKEARIEFAETSQAVRFAVRKRAEGWRLTEIVEELGKLFDENANNKTDNPYGTRKGCRPTKGVVSRWLSEANEIAI